MSKWIAGSTCAAAVLSFAVVSAQTYPQTSGTKPTTSSPSSRSGQTTAPRSRTPSSSRSTRAAQEMTLTGCIMPGSGIGQSPSATASASAANANAGVWILSNASPSSNSASNTATEPNTRAQASRSGSPANEGVIGTNRNGSTSSGVSGSTSTAVGTSGTNTSVDSEAHGGGVAGATDQRGSTVGAGARPNSTSSSATARSTTQQQSAQTSAAAGSSGSASSSSYQLAGITNPGEFSGKRVEVTGTVVPMRTSTRARRNSNATSAETGTPTLRVSEVRVLGDSCQ